MKIVEINHIEHCFDDSNIYGYVIEEPWNESAIRGLSDLGRLQYFKTFPKPFFKVNSTNGLVISGVEGERTCRVVYPAIDGQLLKDRFEKMITQL